MYRIWSEREVPAEFAPLFAGLAELIGPAKVPTADPDATLPEADAVVACGGQYNGAFMDRAPGLLVVSRRGVGYDNVDVPAASARDIAVCITPDAPTISTAEHALALILSAAKSLKKAERSLHREPRGDLYQLQNGLELYESRLGLVGFGRIGRHVARVALALGMHVTAFDPHVSPGVVSAAGVEPVATLEELLRQAHVVSLHLPLSPATRRLIRAETLAQMKPGAILVNASRGGLVDEAALLAALESGHLAGAGLDVTDPEPPSLDNPLLHRDDVIITPHIGSATTAGKRRILHGAVLHAVQVLRGEQPAGLVNPEVWERVCGRLKRA